MMDTKDINEVRIQGLFSVNFRNVAGALRRTMLVRGIFGNDSNGHLLSAYSMTTTWWLPVRCFELLYSRNTQCCKLP
jgi:hypothetical protein